MGLKTSQRHFFIDANDNTLATYTPQLKNKPNIINIEIMEQSGLKDYSIYGFWPYFVFIEDMIKTNWVLLNESTGMGLGNAFLTFSVITRLGLIPLGLY